jgi:hypothetical protein
MDYVSDFIQYIQELLERWPDLAIGGIIGLSWLCFEKFTGREISLKVFFAILGVSFFFAVFGVWREQYRKVKASSGLKAYIESFGSGYNDDGQEMAIYPLVTIYNSGPPNTPRSFSLSIEYRGKTVRSFSRKYVPADNKFFFEGVDKPITLDPSQMLYERLGSPIPEGGHVNGFLMFSEREVPRAEFEKFKQQWWQTSDISLKLTFQDVHDNDYKTAINGGPGKHGNPDYVPGVQNPFPPLTYAETPTPPSPTPDKGASPP